MMVKPFRFGVTTVGRSTGSEWKRKVKEIEAMGYATLLMPDHFVEQVATIPALAMASAYTNQLRVGSVVCNNDFRHPLLLAKEAATIDILSDGRFELGIGAGWLKAEYDAIGMQFDPPGTRVSRFEEAVRLIKAYFSQAPLDFRGEHYTVRAETGLERIPTPVQKPHPPIMVGAGGRRMLSIAAREADIIGIAVKTSAAGSGPDPGDIATSLAQKIAWIREEAGERMDQVELHVQTWAVAVTNDRQQAASALARRFPLPLDLLLDIPYVLIGTIPEIAGQIRNYREQYGISYYSIFEQHMRDFAPVIDTV